MRTRRVALGLGIFLLAVLWAVWPSGSPDESSGDAESMGGPVGPRRWTESRHRVQRSSSQTTVETIPVTPESDAGLAAEPATALGPLPEAHRRAVARWLDAIEEPCQRRAPIPPTYVGPEDEFYEYACVFRSDARPRRTDPDTGWMERPSHVERAPDEVAAYIGSGDRGDYSWDIYFQMRGDGEITGVWLGGFAACPFVVVRAVVKNEVRWLERGEILRNLRGPATEARQSVRLPVTQRALTVRVEERKNEVTYLDDVYVELGGRRLRPVNCPRAPFCRDDEIYARVEPGEFVVLDFEVPASWVGHDVSLFAEGHYFVRTEPPPALLLDLNENGWPR